MRPRHGIRAGGAVLALLLCGCSSEPDGYDPHVRFLLRTDPIVATLPPTLPADVHGSGKLDESIADLASKGGKLLDPSKLPKAERESLAAVLDDLFGTPAAPKLPGTALDLPPEKLAAGSRVYKERCAHCHGSSGDGRGPTGQFVYPHPRDFRLAKFKYVSTTSGLPTPDDLAAVVTTGIAGNSMPSFALLPPDQLDAVVGYTQFLAVRGRVETDLLSAVLGEDGLSETPAAFASKAFDAVMKRFAAAKATVVRPAVPPLEAKDGNTDAAYDDRVRQGFAAFHTAGCAGCHRDYGRETHYRYDDWGVAVRPANLTAGGYRAGGDSLDLFRRVRCGIPPAGMPGVGPATLPDERVWDVVLFLKALPVPRHLPDDVRGKVYK